MPPAQRGELIKRLERDDLRFGRVDPLNRLPLGVAAQHLHGAELVGDLDTFDTPSAASKTIRARCATPAPAVEHRNTVLNLDSSPGRNTIGAATDTPHCPELRP